MMFKRKIHDELIKWKSSPLSKNKALIIKGLRQIGKTYSAMHYAKELYENVVYINFKEDEGIKSVFDGDLKVDRMIMDISARMPNVRFIPNKTVIVFDEIQTAELLDERHNHQ